MLSRCVRGCRKAAGTEGRGLPLEPGLGPFRPETVGFWGLIWGSLLSSDDCVLASSSFSPSSLVLNFPVLSLLLFSFSLPPPLFLPFLPSSPSFPAPPHPSSPSPSLVLSLFPVLLSLFSSTSPLSFTLPLQVYKLLYAARLADYGLASQALHYCEAISQAMLCPGAEEHPVLLAELIKVS